MRNSHKLSPRIEGMESRALLSGTGGAAAAVAAPLAHHTIHLDGTAKGTYNEHQAKADSPKVYNLFGAGDVGLKFRTAVAGTLVSGGSTTSTLAHGKVFLADTRGTITLKLTADKAGGQTGGISDQYDYAIVGGTGIYRNADGHGSIVLTLDKAKPPKTTPGPHGGTSQHGTFDMVFVG